MSDISDQGNDTIAQALALVNLGLKATEAYERPDLGERLQSVSGRLADNTTNVVVVGEFKQGKSSLVNALVNAAVCAVDDDIATAIPAYLTYGDPASASVLLVDPDNLDAGPERQSIEINEVPLYATDAGPYRTDRTKGTSRSNGAPEKEHQTNVKSPAEGRR